MVLLIVRRRMRKTTTTMTKTMKNSSQLTVLIDLWHYLEEDEMQLHKDNAGKVLRKDDDDDDDGLQLQPIVMNVELKEYVHDQTKFD
jgi:hypothetical protein